MGRNGEKSFLCACGCGPGVSHPALMRLGLRRRRRGSSFGLASPLARSLHPQLQREKGEKNRLPEQQALLLLPSEKGPSFPSPHCHYVLPPKRTGGATGGGGGGA